MRSGLLLAPLLLVQAVWFLAPGLLAGFALLRRGIIAAHYVVPVAALVGCLFGYAAFWIYFADRTAGKAYTLATALVGAGAAALVALRRANRESLRTLDVGGPLVLLLLVTLFYNSVTFACSVTPAVVDTGGPIDGDLFCHLNRFTGDNLLPQIFANNVYHGVPRALTWGWQGSDRPPLQAGVTLMQMPLTLMPGWRIAGYQVIATLLQVIWLPGLWALCRSLRLSARRLAVVLTLCVFGGFFFFNSAFTWPKLLAAGLLTIAFGLLFFEPKLTAWTAAIAGVAIGAAMLAHPGVMFTLIPMVVALLLRRFRPNLKRLALTGAAVVAMLAPWQLYTTKYDPPGNELLKWHLAGVTRVDDRTVGQATRDAYTEVPVTTILKNKAFNVGTLVALAQTPRSVTQLLGFGYTARIRYHEISYVVLSLGMFNLGWLALLLRPVRRRLREVMEVSRLKLMLAVVVSSTVIWTLLIYLPVNTVTYQASYATMLLLYAACAAVISVFPRTVVRALVAVQLAYFAVLWVATVWRTHVLHWSSVGLSVVSAAAVLGFLELLRRQIDERDLTVPELAVRDLAASAPAGEPIVAVPVLAGVALALPGEPVPDGP